MTDNINPLVNPWVPMTDPIKVKTLGKLAEEASELATVAARCIIQGIDERHPITGKLNRDWLIEEMADVHAQIYVAMKVLNTPLGATSSRINEKVKLQKQWLDM